MEKKYNIYYSYNFIYKISEIYNYILYELQNKIASYNFQIRIKQTISIIEYFPHAGPKFKNTHYRYLVMKNWIITYRIQDSLIEICEIFNSKQNFNSSNLN